MNRIHGEFSLDHTAAILEARLSEIRKRPVRRSSYIAASSVDPQTGASAKALPSDAANATGSELASLIILCCDQLDYTKLCLESVLRHTRLPFELILIDNGSTDATPEYSEEIQRRSKAVSVKVIRNALNRGFPAGANQGLAAARGRYIVFLNNDVVVTAGWLERLIKCVLHRWPRVGLVGPVTNWPPAQSVPIDYQGLDGLDEFAARHRKKNFGVSKEVELLVGYCLLARREVLDQIGGFDERFGPGYYDDKDLCQRARNAGYQLHLVLDTFVHHFGGRTFKGLGIDIVSQLQNNRALFNAKWQPANSAKLLPKEGARPDVTSRQPRVSLALIVRNEADKLESCLKSVADLVDETVVIDTGSTDATRIVAARCGAKVFDFPWVDDFAAARNESLRRAKGSWIFWLDADEHLNAENRQRLRALFERLKDENVAYVMRQLSDSGDAAGSAAAVDQVRLFRNLPDIRWEHRVHEQILLPLRRAGHDVRWTDIVITHSGYRDTDLSGRKLERNLRLLRLEEVERPDDPVTLYHLGLALGQAGRTAEALAYLRRSLERTPPDFSTRAKIFAMLARGHQRLGERVAALAACRAGLREQPDDPELLFFEALLLRETGDYAAAEASLRRLLAAPVSLRFGAGDPGLRGHKARHLLGEVCREQGKHSEAEQEWRRSVDERPDFWLGWESLAGHYLKGNRWPEFREAVRHMESIAPRSASLLTGRARLAKREYAAACSPLAVAAAREPENPTPKLLLGRALLEGGDVTGAERPLREVLRLAPGHSEALWLLTTVLSRQGRLLTDRSHIQK
jgi:GT2 family glycosyltransferase/Flp pilus assembly protein TadD